MSICYKLVRALAVVLLVTPHIASQSPEVNSTLYSTIDGVSVAFSNENITFTCVVRGSNTVEWTSEQYIGTGGRTLELISTDMPGTTRTSGETVAILVRALQDEVIESRLYIRVQSTISSASVQCRDGGTGAVTSIMFRLADNDTSVACDKPSVCPGEAVTCVCATGSSNTLAWAVDRLEFTSNDPLQTRRSVNASGILTDRYNENRIPVMASNLIVTASTNDTSLLIQCENVDGSTSNAVSVSIPGPDSCPDPSGQVTPPTRNEATSATGTCAGPIAAAVVFPVITIGVAILIVIVVIIIYIKKENDLQSAYDTKQEELEEEYDRKLQEECDTKRGELEEEYKNKLQKECNTKRRELQEEHDKKLREECDTKRRELQEEYDKKLQEECDNKLRELQKEHDKKQSALQRKYSNKMSSLQQEHDTRQRAIEEKMKELEEREKELSTKVERAAKES